MSLLPCPRLKSIGPVLLLAGLSVSCTGDEGLGPANPDPVPLATTGQIAVSVYSDRAELEFMVTIDGAGTWTLGPNEDVRVSGLSPGRYLLNLTLPNLVGTPAPNCLVREGGQRMVTVKAGETATVRYDVDCSSTQGRPRERDPY